MVLKDYKIKNIDLMRHTFTFWVYLVKWVALKIYIEAHSNLRRVECLDAKDLLQSELGLFRLQKAELS